MSGTRIRSVEAVRSGGFAAIRRRRRTEGDALSPDQAAMMWTLLRKPPAPAAGADRFTYRLTVVTEDGAEH
ncbi:MAG TPA: protealysin inhibitor emfourin, partial [Acetobacteraceae bacterium]|nr:protealysin inhibitor emfourin [Acetobacteraceae bacterium]